MLRLQTENMPTDDNGNTNGTNNGGYLRFVNKPQTVLRRSERLPLENKKNRRTTDLHILKDSKTRRKNLAMALIYYKKSLEYDPTKLDNRLS